MRTIVIGGMGVAVAVAVAAMLGVTETLPSNVLLALTAVEEDTREGFMIVCTWRVPDTVRCGSCSSACCLAECPPPFWQRCCDGRVRTVNGPRSGAMCSVPDSCFS